MIIENSYLYISDQVLINDLISNSSKAWHFLAKGCERHLIYWNHYYASRGFEITVADLWTETFIQLAENNHKRLLDFEQDRSSFIKTYMYNKIRAAAIHMINSQKKSGHEISGFEPDDPIFNNDTLDIIKTNVERLELQDEITQAFDKLWHQNSQWAYVFFLKSNLKMTSNNVELYLGLAANTVDKIHKSARLEMAKNLKDVGYEK